MQCQILRNPDPIDANEGELYTRSDGFTYAHEFGHLLGLHDDYFENTPRREDEETGNVYFDPTITYYNDDYPFNIMAGGDSAITSTDQYDKILRDTKCPCGDQSNQSIQYT